MKICLTDFKLTEKKQGFLIHDDLGMLGIRLDDTKLKPKLDKCLSVTGYPRETKV